MIEERVKCEKCGGEARVLKVLAPEEKKPRRRRGSENWIYLRGVVTLVYQCQKCTNVFSITKSRTKQVEEKKD